MIYYKQPKPTIKGDNMARIVINDLSQTKQQQAVEVLTPEQQEKIAAPKNPIHPLVYLLR